MIQFLAALVPLLGGLTQPLKDYFKYKATRAEKLQELELARIVAEKDTVTSNNEAQTQQIQARLSATSRTFKQWTFLFIVVPFVLSITLPNQAAVMWANLELIPEWFRLLFSTIYLTIWGINVIPPYIDRIFQGITKTRMATRTYKIKKAEIRYKELNQKVLFGELKKELGPLSQQFVDTLNNAQQKARGES